MLRFLERQYLTLKSIDCQRSPERQLTAHRKGSYHPCRRSLFNVSKPAACHESKTKAEKYRAGGGGLSVLRTDLFLPSPVSHEGLRVVLEMLAQRTPAGKLEMSVDKYVDERALDELEREGLFRKISGKG